MLPRLAPQGFHDPKEAMIDAGGEVPQHAVINIENA
jgi:hypothetical protein